MPWFIPGITGIVVAIGAAIVAVATWVAAVMVAVVTAIVAALTVVWSVAVGFVVGILEGVGLMSGMAAATTMQSLGALTVAGVSTYATTALYVAAVYGALSSFLEVIQFKMLMTIHRIAYFVSAKYRNYITKVYTRISEFSHALGLGAAFVTLAIRNARSMVLTTSSLLGRKYDIGELTWLREFDAWTKEVSAKATEYQGNPGLILYDLDEWLVRPSVDLMGETMRAVFTTLESGLKIMDDTVQDIVEVRNEVEKLVSQLPDFLSEEILPYLNKVTKYVDDFITDEYGPRISQLDGVLSILNDRQDDARTDISTLVARLKRPGDLLLGVDDLPSWLRQDQEQKMGDAASRVYRRDATETSSKAHAVWLGLYKIRDLLKEKVIPPVWHVPEVLAPVKLPISEIDQARTWFVGDY